MNFVKHRAWQAARPLLADAVSLFVTCFVVVALASASDLGRPGSGYLGNVFFIGVVGALMAYHSSPARRVVCFVVLLLALVGLRSEKSSSDAWGRLKYHIQTEQMRRNYEHSLTESEAKASASPPSATP